MLTTKYVGTAKIDQSQFLMSRCDIFIEAIDPLLLRYVCYMRRLSSYVAHIWLGICFTLKRMQSHIMHKWLLWHWYESNDSYALQCQNMTQDLYKHVVTSLSSGLSHTCPCMERFWFQCGLIEYQWITKVQRQSSAKWGLYHGNTPALWVSNTMPELISMTTLSKISTTNRELLQLQFKTCLLPQLPLCFGEETETRECSLMWWSAPCMYTCKTKTQLKLQASHSVPYYPSSIKHTYTHTHTVWRVCYLASIDTVGECTPLGEEHKKLLPAGGGRGRGGGGRRWGGRRGGVGRCQLLWGAPLGSKFLFES